MAHSEHNRPKGSGMILIAIGILIFVFAPYYAKNDIAGGIAIMIFGFLIGGLGFYIAFWKKRKS
jgi:protein-S-isoprenylcysteine O-methyltransferase Ste14